MKYLTTGALSLLLIFSSGTASAQRGGDDTKRPSDEPAEETTTDDPQPTAIPSKVFADGVIRDLSAWRHAAARTELEKKRAEIGETTPYLTAWSYLLATERKLDEAIVSLQTAVHDDSEDPVACFLLGEVRSWKNQRDGANQAWQMARNRANAQLTENPADARARYWLGASQIRLGDFGTAKTNLTQALEAGFSPAMTNYEIGLAETYQKKWNQAKTAFDRCLEADSGFAHAYYYRARIFKELGNTEQMLIDLDRFLTLAPDAREANAARSLLRAGGG